MADFRDLVLIRHYNSPALFLFEAPAYSCLEPGDKVICKTSIGDSDGKVVACETYLVGSNQEKMLIEACNATLPLKRVIKRAVFYDITYPEDKNE